LSPMNLCVMQTDAMSGAPTAMTQSTDPDQSLAAAIRALRHEILSAGRRLAWDDVRGRIRALIKDGRPSPDERIQLLELYDRAVTTVQRRCWEDAEASRRLAYQRANDTLVFLLAEVRDQGEDARAVIAAIIARELPAGRIEFGSYFNNILSLVLEKFGDGEDGAPPGLAEDDAGPFSVPPPLSRPPASPPAQPSR
jgi:hypothetical protein